MGVKAERASDDRSRSVPMMGFLIVFIGAGIGGAIRHGVNLAAARLVGPSFPYGTLTINVVGSLVMGLCVAYFAFKGDASQPWRLFLTTGILGGFTTFSTFSLDTALLWERGDMLGTAFYVLGSVILSLIAIFLALWLGRSVLA
jgi:CrcB protein